MDEGRYSWNNSADSSKFSNMLPMSQHANVPNDFSDRDKFQSSNFLCSLPDQKPRIEATPRAGLHNLKVERPWQLLSSVKLSSKSYVKPGKTQPLAKDFSSSASQESRQASERPSLGLNSASQGHVQIRQTFSASTCGKVGEHTAEHAATSNNSYPQAVNGVSSNFAVQFGEMLKSGNAYHDDIDDDDIFENIDAEDLEYYQPTHAPQPLISKVPPVTPVASKGISEGPEKTSMPPEPSMKCRHGHNLGSCREASVHLQELKDIRMRILYDLRHNITMLNADQMEKLHQDRVQLYTQFQQLEEHLRATSLSYCETVVDCRRDIRSIHIGEKFASFVRRKECDKCSRTENCMEEDVTTIAKHLVELVKMTGQQFSSDHILEVYGGSLNQFVKKHKHETLSLYGAGKHLPEGKASHVLHHLVVIEEILMEDVDSESLSFVLTVNNSGAYDLFSGSRAITLRSGKTPTKVPLISGKQSPPEPSMKCRHGHNLGSCREASVHLQELKEIRMRIVSDLCHNIAMLNADQMEKLHQDRVQLYTQFQQLEEHLRAISLSYCETVVDCRRDIRSIHIGEKFASFVRRKECDKCCKTENCMEEDVTKIAKHLVELVKMTGQQLSSDYIWEVYGGSLNQFVKKHKHERLSLHGAGKDLPEGKASHVLHHVVVIEEVLMEGIDSESLSFVLTVNNSGADDLFSGSRAITLRSGKPPAKAPLISGKQSPPEVVSPGQLENQVDLNLSAKLYSALRTLRATFVKESAEGTVGYHIFGNGVLKRLSERMPRTMDGLLEIDGIGRFKASKYGDRLLETIEATIREHYKTEKNGGGGSSNESVKRRRDPTEVPQGNSKDEGDFTEAIGCFKKRIRRWSL